MFYDNVFTHDEKQVLLSLAETHYLVKVDCPEFLKKSKHAIEIRHVVTNRRYGSSMRNGMMTTNFVPRIHAADVQRLVRRVRDEASRSSAQLLAKLFELGLGVPKQKDIAVYLNEYTREADKKGVGIKYIRKLINEYHRRYRRSMAGSRWLMPAAYTANMLNMQKFIHLQENGYQHKVKVPDGLPVVLVYQNTVYETGEFHLCDAFMISPLGYPVPFAQIALRPEFKAVPQSFCSKALRGKGMYSMVMGMMYWEDGDAHSNFSELMEIDADNYVTMLDMPKYADRRSPEYQEMLDQRTALNADRTKWRDVLDKYGNTTRTLKPEQVKLLEEAHKYFVNRSDKSDFFKAFSAAEKKENHRAAKKFAVANAQFVAVDCGTIMDRTTYMAVSTTLDKVHNVLGKWGFSTVKTVNASLKKSVLTYNDSNASRIWSL